MRITKELLFIRWIIFDNIAFQFVFWSELHKRVLSLSLFLLKKIDLYKFELYPSLKLQ